MPSGPGLKYQLSPCRRGHAVPSGPGLKYQLSTPRRYGQCVNLIFQAPTPTWAIGLFGLYPISLTPTVHEEIARRLSTRIEKRFPKILPPSFSDVGLSQIDHMQTCQPSQV